jgi:MoxR-like ATPase
VDRVQISEEVVQYIVACVRETRRHPDVLVGASPRTGVKVSRLIRSLSLVRGTDFVTIDMVKEVFHSAVSHRLILRDPDMSANEIIDSVLSSVPVEQRRRRRSDA